MKWSMKCLPFRSTWLHHRYLVGFVSLVFCAVFCGSLFVILSYFCWLCIVCPSSMYAFWLCLWHPHILLACLSNAEQHWVIITDNNSLYMIITDNNSLYIRHPLNSVKYEAVCEAMKGFFICSIYKELIVYQIIHQHFFQYLKYWILITDKNTCSLRHP